MKCQLLPVEMFQDDSMECLNFWIGSNDGELMIEYDKLVASFDKHVIDSIKEARLNGKSYIQCNEYYKTIQIVQIVWG